MNITDPIRRRAAEHPHRPAVIRRAGTVSYRDLDRTIDAVARRALDAGLAPGNTAVIALPSPYGFLVSALALARAGIATAPTTLPTRAVDACFAASSDATTGYARTVTVDATWTECPPAAGDVPPVPSHQDGAATCCIFGSSGTTGSCKHVAVSHDLMARRIAAKQHVTPLPADVRQICLISPRVHYGFRDMVRVLWAGGVVVRAVKANDVMASVLRHDVNYMVTSPAMLRRVIAALPVDAGPFPSLGTIQVGGSPLPARLYEQARERLCANIVSAYGSTETGSIAAAPMAALAGRVGAVGFLGPGVEAQAVDADHRPLPTGTQGVLRIRSDTCVGEYVGDPAATALAFRDGWFYPGDIGSISSDRVLHIVGRSSELINIGGTKVSPYAIEEVLLSLDQIHDAAVFGMPDAMGLTQVWAAIVPNGKLDLPVLDALFRQRLRATAPRYVLQLDRLPRNEGGKVLRDELVRLAAASRGGPP